MSEPPKTFAELFAFYYSHVKPLYSFIQTENNLPIELLFEINAAFDHVTRHWAYGQSEGDVVRQAYSHLKRSCLDVFKLQLKATMVKYRELRKTPIELIDNGDFKRNLEQLINQIQRHATEARRLEGQVKTDPSTAVQAFDAWYPTVELFAKFEEEFYLNKHVDWAKKRSRIITLRNWAGGIISGAIITAFFQDPLAQLAKSAWNFIERLFR